MSHYSVAVFADGTKTVNELLAPFHEFECTGTVDQYVISIDKLDELKQDYAASTMKKLKAQDGTLHYPWDDKFYREPTDEEKSKMGSMPGSGCGDGISWCSRDWQDGRGYRAKVRFIPDGYTEIEVRTSEIMSLRDYINGEHELPVLLIGDEPDINDAHKWGWMRVDAEGNVIEVIKRTNPNAKWDWYTEGGRWINYLPVIGGSFQDEAKARQIDFEALSENKRKDRVASWERYQQEEDKRKEDKFFKTCIYGIPESVQSLDEWLAMPVKPFATYAVVTPDGKWHEAGRMGWWGVSHASDDQREEFKTSYHDCFIVPAIENDWTITIVDCHI